MATVKKAPAKKSVSTRKAAPAAKKATKTTTAKKVMPPVKIAPTRAKKKPIEPEKKWSAIHVFGYGESQISGIRANGKVPNRELKALAPLLAALAKKQQKGTKLSLDDAHSLTFFNGVFVDFCPRSAANKRQRFAWDDIDAKAVDKLADELLSKVPKQKAGADIMTVFTENQRPVVSEKKLDKRK